MGSRPTGERSMTNVAAATVAASVLALVGEDVVGVWVRRPELAVALGLPGAAAAEGAYALALRALAPAVRQPAYELDGGGAPRRRDEVLTGLAALANLHGAFGAEDGLRRLYLSNEALATMSVGEGFDDAVDVVSAVDAAREAERARRPRAARAAVVATPVDVPAAAPVAADDRFALLVTASDLSAARRHLIEGGVAASAYAMGVAILVGAIDQDAYEASEEAMRPLGHRLRGRAGLENLAENFHGPDSVAGGTRRLKFDRATVEALRADDEGTARVIAFVEAMSARRQLALTTAAGLRRRARAAAAA